LELSLLDLAPAFLSILTFHQITAMLPKMHMPHRPNFSLPFPPSLLDPKKNANVDLVASSLSRAIQALRHALVHESKEANRTGADSHAVNKAGSEERAENGAEVGVGHL
jgi:hypothetical protein